MVEPTLFSTYPKKALQILGHDALFGGIFGTKVVVVSQIPKLPSKF